MKTTTRADLWPIIKTIERRRPLLGSFAQLWLTAYAINPEHNNLKEFERILLGDLLNGQYNPSEILTPSETRIARFFYDRGATVGHHQEKENAKMEYSKPEGQLIGEFFKGPHWSPAKSAEVLQESSGHPASYTSKTIQGRISPTTAYNRPHFSIATEQGEFLLPDHGALMQRLKLLEPGDLVWLGYGGKVDSSEGRQFHSYEVIKITK